MGIRDEIFEEFFIKLKEDKEFPDEIINKLKNIWENKESLTKNEILEIIEQVSENNVKN